MKWKAAIPPGHSSPVFTNSHIFLTAHSPDKDNYKLFVLALDRKSGKELWRHEVERRQKGRLELVNGPASPSPGDRRQQRLFLLPGIRTDQLHRRRQGTLAHAARSVHDVLRFRRVADSRRRHVDSLGRSGDRSVRARDRREDRQAEVAHHASARDLGLLDADDLAAEDRTRADSHPGVIPAHRVFDRRRQEAVVGARARVRNEIRREHRRRHALCERLGIRTEPGRHADPDRRLRGRPQAVRCEQRRLRRPRRSDQAEHRTHGSHAASRIGLRCVRRQSRRQARRARLGHLPLDARRRERLDGDQARWLAAT